MHLNSLTPMRISGTPRSFLNLDSCCPTSIVAVAIGGGSGQSAAHIRGLVGFDEHVVLIIGLSPAAPQRGIELGLLGAGARRALSIVLNPGSCAQLRDMRDWDDGHRGTSWFKDTV